MTDSRSAEKGRGQVGSAAHRAVRLDHSVRAWVEPPRVRDAFRALLAADLSDCAVSWPHAVRSLAGASWLRRGDVCVELARSPADVAEHVSVSLTADTAARLIDALLGGRAGSSMASASGQPSEAECGVLAYLAARLLASRTGSPGAAWLVRDVRPCSERFELASDCVVWPLALQSSLGTLELSLCLSQTSLAAQPQQHTLSLSLAERVDRETLAQLAVGDVWLCADSALTLTSEGLLGPVQLSVAGCSTIRSGRLARGRVRLELAEPARPADSTTEGIELVIATRNASLLELAGLSGGESLCVDASGRQPAAIRHRGDVIATGELISWRGALGIRIANR